MKYLETYRLADLPDRAYYIQDFVSEAEEQFLLQKILNAPPAKWTTLSHRRLQTWPTQLLKGSILPTAEAIPSWLEDPLIPRMVNLGMWSSSPHNRPNHCLINEYEPGQGIMPHEDGDVYHPMVATISLNDSIVLDMFQKSDDTKRAPKYRVFQEPRSLLITTEDLYTEYLHGIQEIDIDRDLSKDTVSNWDLLREDTKRKIEDCAGDLRRQQTRISLTYRDVKKVRNLATFLHRK